MLHIHIYCEHGIDRANSNLGTIFCRDAVEVERVLTFVANDLVLQIVFAAADGAAAVTTKASLVVTA